MYELPSNLLSRRNFLHKTAGGLGGLALSTMLS
ncbi:MAG: twin-arginine translocation signal domain-containing protein, partial [Opitutae bacterium]|nr:twin-arginine translocation signal domain-containing protein [Opitutae bacterium]